MSEIILRYAVNKTKSVTLHLVGYALELFTVHGPLNVKLDFSLKVGYIGSLKFGSYYLQYVPASKPFDHV